MSSFIRPSALLPLAARAVAALSLACSTTAYAQLCGRWNAADAIPGLYSNTWWSGTHAAIYSAVVWDPDGAGPAAEVVVVNGDFRVIGQPGAVGVAIWDGDQWRLPPIAMALNESSARLATHLGDLIAISPSGVRRWTGTSWESIAALTFSQVSSRFHMLHSAQSRLYLGGNFTSVNGIPMGPLVSWDGLAWRSEPVPADWVITALASDAANLYVGGHTSSGTTLSPPCVVASRPLSAANGWTTLPSPGYRGGGILGSQVPGIAQIVPHADGLYIAGTINSLIPQPSRNVMLWNGQVWTSDDSTKGNAFQLRSAGNALYLGGVIGPVTNARVDARGVLRKGADGVWSPVAGGLLRSNVQTLLEFRGELLAFGTISQAGDTAADHAVRWDGTAWRPLGRGVAHAVAAITEWSGQAVVVGERFVSRLGPDGWTPAGPAFNGAHGSLCAVAAVGAELYVAGNACLADVTTNCPHAVHRLNGFSWQTLPPLVSGGGEITQLHDFRGQLIAAGSFASPVPGAGNIARFDGTQWHPLAGGIPAPSHVRALADFQDDLIVGGTFSAADAPASRNVARWTGDAWAAMGNGLAHEVTAFAVWRGRLYANTTYAGVFEWTGANWQPVTPQAPRVTYGGELAVYGDRLVRADHRAIPEVFDGVSWRHLTNRTNPNSVQAMKVIGNELFLGCSEPDVNGLLQAAWVHRFTLGGDAPTGFESTTPATISVRANGAKQILFGSLPETNLQFTLSIDQNPVTDTARLSIEWRPRGDRVDVWLRVSDTQPQMAGRYRLDIANPCGVRPAASFDLSIKCPGDFNTDDDVDADDLFAYLHAYFMGSFDAQHGPTRMYDAVTVSDLFAFLNDYLTPCP